MGHVLRLEASVRRNLKQPHRFVLFKPEPVDEHLTKIKGCFARMRMFDPEWQVRHGIDDRLVCIDLDTVITGELDPLFDRPEPFVIMQGGNAANPCPYNGALMMLRRGAHPELWQDFSPEAAGRLSYYAFPDDQGWIAHKAPGAAGWKCGKETGVYVFQKPGWPRRGKPGSDDLPDGARLVTFINRDPKDLQYLGWVRENWR